MEILKYKCVRKRGGLYQSKNPFIRWYFYKRFDIALEISEISKDDVVLEIGTQEGFLVPSLVSNADKVYTCDINTTIIREEHAYCYEWGRGKTFLSLGRELLSMELGDEATKKAMFFYADGQHLPFKDKSFSLVFILDCLEHMRHPANKLTISEVFRVLKGEGIFICSLPIENGVVLFPREIIRKMIRYPGPKYSLKELIKASIHNEAIGEWKGDHEGYDYIHELKRIKNLFMVVYIYYAPFSLLRTWNPTDIIKAKKLKTKKAEKSEEGMPA